MPQYTRAIAEFAASLQWDAIPAEMRQRAKRHLLDSIGCALYSSTLPHCEKVIRVLNMIRGTEDASILGTSIRTSAVHAALANGTLISGFELDDVGVYVHPSACVVAAGLAAAELKGGIDGKRLLAGLVVGYEVTIRVSEAVGPIAELEIGWHTPGFHGALGAAACAGHILGLNKDEMLRAISIAADMAGGGLMSARNGADVKRLHCGLAAESGVLAALLGREGFTGTPDVLEHDPWGYCATMTYTGAERKNYDLAKLTDGLGEKFIGLDRIALKYYPIGGDQHSIVENVLALKREHGFLADAVERLIIHVTKFAFKNKLRAPAENLTTANFSAKYCAAMALTYDLPPLFESPLLLRLWPDAYKDPNIVALQERIEEVVDEELNRKNAYSIDSSVIVRLKDGRELRRTTEWVKDAPRGTIWLKTLTDEHVQAKFRNLAGTRFPAAHTEALVGGVFDLERISDVSNLLRSAVATA